MLTWTCVHVCMYEYCVAVDAFILQLSFANFSAEVVKSLTTRVDRLEKQYDLLLQQYFVLASAHNSTRSSSSHFLPPSFGESVMPAPSLLTTTFTESSKTSSSAASSIPTTPTPSVTLTSSLSATTIVSSFPITPTPSVTRTTTLSATPIVSAPHQLVSTSPGTHLTPGHSPGACLQPETLLDPDAVIRKYPKYLNLASACRLAV